MWGCDNFKNLGPYGISLDVSFCFVFFGSNNIVARLTLFPFCFNPLISTEGVPW